MNKEMSFKLSAPLKVTKDGQFEETSELTLVAPSMKDRKQAANLLQIVKRSKKRQESEILKNFTMEQIEAAQATAESRAVEVNEDEGEPDLRDVICSYCDDLEVFYSTFDTLALRVCNVLDETPLLKSHLEQMSLCDYEEMCFEYVANFIK
tara:strand:- start:327 stop:779 length:453 start_codon:yes stop_codon:yes gene_type:complete